MPNKELAEAKLPASRRELPNWRDAKERVRLRELIEAAIEKMHKNLIGDGFKPTLGDYAKLLQMQKELDEEGGEAKEIKVTWVDPTDTESEG